MGSGGASEVFKAREDLVPAFPSNGDGGHSSLFAATLVGVPKLIYPESVAGMGGGLLGVFGVSIPFEVNDMPDFAGSEAAEAGGSLPIPFRSSSD